MWQIIFLVGIGSLILAAIFFGYNWIKSQEEPNDTNPKKVKRKRIWLDSKTFYYKEYYKDEQLN